MSEERSTEIETTVDNRIDTEAVSHANAVELNDTAAYAEKTISGETDTAKDELPKPGRIDTVRKVLSAIGCVLMLLSILFPFLRMTEPNDAVTDLSRVETFTIGMPGWDAGPYVIWVLIILSCALILGFQLKNQRKKARHGCRLAFLILLFDVLTIAGFVAQYGPSDILCFPLAGFWLLAAGWLISWIASFLHKRKRRPEKNRKGRRNRKDDPGQATSEVSDNFNDTEAPDRSEYGDGDESAGREKSAEKSGKKLYREMKKQQKQEREERMRKAAEKRDDSQKNRG